MKATRKIVAVCLAATLGTAALGGTAFAYFTDFQMASGQKEIALGYSVDLDEELDGLDKSITMRNTGDTDVFVRVYLFGAEGRDGVDVSVNPTGAQSGWTQDDPADATCWSYETILTPEGQGSASNPLKVEVNPTDESGALPDDAFDIVVVGQASPVAYTPDGKPYPYNWTAVE